MRLSVVFIIKLTASLQPSFPAVIPLFGTEKPNYNKMSKKPWGTITHPKERNSKNLLGHQKLSSREIDAMVNRLFIRDWSNRHNARREKEDCERRLQIKERPLSAVEKKQMVERLTRNSARKAPDANRTGSMSVQGICNTYAWKGWN